MNKKALIALLLVIIVALGGGLYYKQYLDENEAPPSIQATGTYQGLTSAKPTGFLKAGKSQLGKAFESTKGDGEEKASLKAERDSGGLSDVYSEDDTDFSEVMENFKASKTGQEYMVGFYDNNDTEWKTTKQTHYGTQGISVIRDEDDLVDTEIPANNAFVFVSNENSELYGYKDTSEEPSESYNFCRDGKEGWTAGVVVEDELYDSLVDCLDSVTSVWVKVRNAPLNDKFEKIYTAGKSDSALKKYKMKKFYMAWVKFSEDPVIAEEEETPAKDTTVRPELKDLKVISDSKDLGRGKVVLDDKGIPAKSLEFSWNSSFDANSVAQYKKIAKTDPVLSYTWKLKDASAKVIWEFKQEDGTKSGDGVSNTQDDSACFKPLYDKAGKELASGKDWICKYVSIPADLSLTADTAYSFELTAFDGKATAISRIDFATEKTAGSTTGKTAEQLAAEAKTAAEEALKALAAEKLALETKLKDSTLAAEKVLLENQIKELKAKIATLDDNLKKLSDAATKAAEDAAKPATVTATVDSASQVAQNVKQGAGAVSLASFKVTTDKDIGISGITLGKLGSGATVDIKKIYVLAGAKELTSVEVTKETSFPLSIQISTTASKTTVIEIKADISDTAVVEHTYGIKLEELKFSDSSTTTTPTTIKPAISGNLMTIIKKQTMADSITKVGKAEDVDVYPGDIGVVVSSYTITVTKEITLAGPVATIAVTEGGNFLENNTVYINDKTIADLDDTNTAGTQVSLTAGTHTFTMKADIKADAPVGTVIKSTLNSIELSDGSKYEITSDITTQATINPKTFTAFVDNYKIIFVTNAVAAGCTRTVSAVTGVKTAVEKEIPTANVLPVFDLLKEYTYGEYTLTLKVACPGITFSKQPDSKKITIVDTLKIGTVKPVQKNNVSLSLDPNSPTGTVAENTDAIFADIILKTSNVFDSVKISSLSIQASGTTPSFLIPNTLSAIDAYKDFDNVYAVIKVGDKEIASTKVSPTSAGTAVVFSPPVEVPENTTVHIFLHGEIRDNISTLNHTDKLTSRNVIFEDASKITDSIAGNPLKIVVAPSGANIFNVLDIILDLFR